MATIRRYIYEYSRWNPQIGTSIRESEVYETTIKKAEKVARRHCDDTIYGSATFIRIKKQSDPIVLGVDVEARMEYIGEWPHEKKVTEYRQLFPKTHSAGWDKLKDI